jgi:hypothetical protein
MRAGNIRKTLSGEPIAKPLQMLRSCSPLGSASEVKVLALDHGSFARTRTFNCARPIRLSAGSSDQRQRCAPATPQRNRREL